MTFVLKLALLTTVLNKASAHIRNMSSYKCNSNLHGNGICDWMENTVKCGYDGGDCCMQSCKVTTTMVVNEVCKCGETLKKPQCGEWYQLDCMDPKYALPRADNLPYNITFYTANNQVPRWTGLLEVGITGEPKHFCLDNKVAKKVNVTIDSTIGGSEAVLIHPITDNVDRVSFVTLRNLHPTQDLHLVAGMIVIVNNLTTYYRGSGPLLANGANTIQFIPGGADLVWYDVEISFANEQNENSLKDDAGFKNGTLFIQIQDARGRGTTHTPIMYGPVDAGKSYKMKLLTQAIDPVEVTLFLESKDISSNNDMFKLNSFSVKHAEYFKNLQLGGIADMLGHNKAIPFVVNGWVKPNSFYSIYCQNFIDLDIIQGFENKDAALPAGQLGFTSIWSGNTLGRLSHTLNYFMQLVDNSIPDNNSFSNISSGSHLSMDKQVVPIRNEMIAFSNISAKVRRWPGPPQKRRRNRAADENSQAVYNVVEYTWGVYPDMEVDAIQMIRNMIYTEVSASSSNLQCASEECMLKTGTVVNGVSIGDKRKLLRFETTVWNIGLADMYPPANSAPIWHLCHKHWHALVGFTRYTLTAAGTFAGTSLMGAIKNSHCAVDSYCNRGSGSPKFLCTAQGISHGCADRYGEWLDCQWIELTPLSSGWYNLNVIVNPLRTLPEMDYTNNEVHILIKYNSNGGISNSIEKVCLNLDESMMECPPNTPDFNNFRGKCGDNQDCVRAGHLDPLDVYDTGRFPGYGFAPFTKQSNYGNFEKGYLGLYDGDYTKDLDPINSYFFCSEKFAECNCAGYVIFGVPGSWTKAVPVMKNTKFNCRPANFGLADDSIGICRCHPLLFGGNFKK